MTGQLSVWGKGGPEKRSGKRGHPHIHTHTLSLLKTAARGKWREIVVFWGALCVAETKFRSQSIWKLILLSSAIVVAAPLAWLLV